MTPRIGAVLPQALLLAIPLVYLLWPVRRPPGIAWTLRVVALALLVLALVQPTVRLAGGGTDLVVVVDRSASMPAGSEAKAQELIRLLERERRPGDRLAVVGFGREPAVEERLEPSGFFPGFQKPVDADVSRLGEALERAAELIPGDRRGALFVLSDGQSTEADLGATAQRLAGRGVPVHHRLLARDPPESDAAVISIDLPSEVGESEPFQLSAVVYASRPQTAEIRLERDGQTLATGPRALVTGENVLLFHDRIEKGGLARYRLSVAAPQDGLRENDTGTAVLRVSAPDRVLLITRNGGGVLDHALVRGGLRVRAQSPGPVSWSDLEGVAAVVLDNVEADALTESGLATLAQFVSEAGGGLTMTGGRRSFGEGGYRRSPLEDVLPVSLEVRQEQRRAALAMSIVMDCSGSMAATLPDGRTKMRLAGEGAVAALTLLGPNDEASVHLIDTVPHEIFGLRPMSSNVPLDKVASGFSGGGGILVGVALRAARDEILKSHQSTRHVVLFADASDATDPDDYKKTLAELRAEHVTVSVIGMGNDTDSDAKLLKEVAQLGGGRIYFAQSAASLPRVFSQETLVLARSSFVDVPVNVRWTADLALLGAIDARAGLRTDGYNLTYARPEAAVGLRSDDENTAPVLAFHPAGRGHAAAFTAEVDGRYTGALRGWSGYRGLLSQMVRWSLPSHAESAGWTARAIRDGADLHVTLALEEGSPPPEVLPRLVLLREGATPMAPIPLRWESEGQLGARVPLTGHGVHHAVLQMGAQTVRLPPVTLAYSPEFAPRRPEAGAEALRAISRLTHGTERTSMAGLFTATPESAAAIPLAPWLVAAAALAALLEVFVRRALIRLPARATPSSPATVSSAARAPGGEQSRASGQAKGKAAAATPTEPPATPDALETALTAARKRAKDRTRR